MRRTRSVLLTFLTSAVVLLGLTAPATATAPPAVAGPATTVAKATTTPTLVSVRVGKHATFDRVVWTFTGGLPKHRSVKYVPELLGDASGLPVRIAGSSILQVTMSNANAHDSSGSTAPSRAVAGLANVIEVARSGDFEAVVTYGVGLAKHETYRLFTLRNPSRVVLDVSTSFAKVKRTVSFLNLPRFAVGTEPYTQKLVRIVPKSGARAALVHQLFAGPTAAERRAGLRTVRSGATGFTTLRVSYGVARIRLAGGCNSRGSTMTIANLLMPTLKRFASIDHVKIYDPSGHTQTPSGHSDSIPVCLEP